MALTQLSSLVPDPLRTEKFIYHYGQDGNVLSEISDTGKPLANYVYLNGNLVARFGESDRKSVVASWLLLLLGDKGETL